MTLTLVPISPSSLAVSLPFQARWNSQTQRLCFRITGRTEEFPRRTFHTRGRHVSELSRGSSPSGHGEKQYKAVRKRGWVSQVFCLLTTMRSSLFLLALAAANGVIASLIPSDDYYRPSADLTNYINSLVPVAKDVMLHKIAGPALGPGVDVNSPLVLHLLRSMLMLLYLACRPHNGHARGGPPRLPHLLGP
jgi:hypothetical protein